MKTNDKTRITLPSFLIEPNDVFHIVRRTITVGEVLKYHDHDYVEVFWIKDGSGFHIINGEKHKVEKGLLCLIRPTDTHTFVATNNQTGLIITNVAFYLENLHHYKERYFHDSKNFFWSDEKLPYTTMLNYNQLNEISTITDCIIYKKRDNIHLDILMIHIFTLLTESFEEEASDIPHWLALALKKYNSPEQFAMGTHGFVKLTGRTTDHVNKVIKQRLNQTLTETVTKIKINYAAQRLTFTNVPIKNICDDCGFKTIGHFYKVFKKYNGITPNKYREINHKVI